MTTEIVWNHIEFGLSIQIRNLMLFIALGVVLAVGGKLITNYKKGMWLDLIYIHDEKAQ